MDLHNHGVESKWLVFISSVMDDDLNPARELAVKAIEELPFGQPWAFEYTPASSQSATDVYLRKVEEADFVVWLVGSNTSQAVINEVHQCLGCQGRLLVFKLPTHSRDENTTALLEKVTRFVKWKDVRDLSQLAPEIIASMSEEIREALRNPLGPARNRILDRALDRSFADCAVSFSALGVSEDLVNGLAYDPDVGNFLDGVGSGFYVIEGPQGAGKTLASRRLFQKAVEHAKRDLSAVFPMFVYATDVKPDLWETIDRNCKGYVDFRVQSVLVIVDGVDELGSVKANTLLREMESFIRANPKATLVATVRPTPGLKHNGTAITMPRLDDDEVVSLVGKISGVPPETLHPTSWSDSLLESSRSPLFSVMIGVWLRQSFEMRGLSSHELVEYLAQASLTESGGSGEDTDGLLQGLAVKAVTCGSRVSPHEVTPRLARQKQLADSRLVQETERGVDFALPIFREWYAARAILEGTILVNQIDLESDRWTVPLSIAAHSDNTAVAQAVMTHLAAVNPSVAAAVLKEDESAWFKGGVESGAPAEATSIGEEISRTMRVWSKGLGPLFGVIGPVGPDGSVATLGVRVDGSRLGRSWYCGDEKLGPVVEFNASHDPLKHDAVNELKRVWPKWTISAVPPTKLWNWMITKGDLVRNLGEALSRRLLSNEVPDAVDELVWEFAKAVGRGIGQHSGAIDIGSVLEKIQGFPVDNRTTLEMVGNVYGWSEFNVDNRTTLEMAGNVYGWSEINIVSDRLSGLLKGGQEALSDPWPNADLAIKPGQRLLRYSDKRLLERTQCIYGSALRIYRAIVEKWFTSFADRLLLYRLMPVRLEGQLLRGDRDEVGMATLSWRPVILPAEQCSSVVFNIGTRRETFEFDDVYFESQREAFARLRRGDTARLALFQTSTCLHVGNSRLATQLAYEWLSDELKNLGWTEW